MNKFQFRLIFFKLSCLYLKVCRGVRNVDQAVALNAVKQDDIKERTHEVC